MSDYQKLDFFAAFDADSLWLNTSVDISCHKFRHVYADDRQAAATAAFNAIEARMEGNDPAYRFWCRLFHQLQTPTMPNSSVRESQPAMH